MGKTILKKRVDLSIWSTIMTILAMAVIIGICIWQFNRTENEALCWLLLAIVLVWGVLTLFYCPMYVRLTEDSLEVDTSLRVKSFPLDEIAEVKICPPTMSEHRICGSGGFFGYWGWFREPSIGKYFAYYGMASQTFLIRLKSGKLYMLGCRDSKEMAKALGAQLTKIKNNNDTGNNIPC